MQKQERDEIKKFCAHLARESGQIIREYFRTGVTVDRKADSSPVTIADLKTEEFLREAIMKEFPDHGILGEEFGSVNEEARYRWILDPIDGTKSFICGVPLFGTLIALLEEGEPVVGAIHIPVAGDLMIGDNVSCELNGAPVRCREIGSVDSAVLLATDHRDASLFQKEARFEDLVKRVRIYRTWGDCYGYYLLAAGYADIMADPVMSTWDTMALIPVIRGAGGVITDFRGGDPVKNPKSVVAAGPDIHGTVMHILWPPGL